MELTAAEFAKLIHDLKCDIRPGERRTNPRAPTRAKIQVIPVILGEKSPTRQTLWAKDISRTGIGLMSATKYEEGSRLLVLLPKNACESFVLLVEIVRTTRMPGNTYVMGSRLIRRVTPEEYDSFLGGVSDAIVTLTTAA